MKTKMISFVFLMAFVMTNVRCIVDASGTCGTCCGLPIPRPDELLPGELLPIVPPSQVPPLSESHSYTPGEADQVRQNLIGSYRGIVHGQDARLDIRAENIIFVTINGIERPTDYHTFFLDHEQPLLMFGYEDQYYIEFTRNSYTEVIGLRHESYPFSYFHKILPHDEP